MALSVFLAIHHSMNAHWVCAQNVIRILVLVYLLLLPLGPIVPSESSGKGQEANHHKQPESTINEGVFPVQDIIAGTPGLETSSSTYVFRKMIVLKNI